MVLDIQGELTSRAAENVYNTIHDSYVPGDELEISIDSRGGYFNAAVSIMMVLKYLQMAGSHITIHNTGPAMSAATVSKSIYATLSPTEILTGQEKYLILTQRKVLPILCFIHKFTRLKVIMTKPPPSFLII